MTLSISPVETKDVDLLARKVEFPAHQDGPLSRLMFPHSQERSLEQTEDENRWSTDGLLETVHQEDEALYKACGEDGSPVGLIGWTKSPGASSKGLNNRDRFCPPSLDVASWLDISKRLREERQRVIQACPGNGICQITFMAVDPNHQRQGVGSTLMKIFCDYVDNNALDAFVLSSPAGIRLYSRFGFEAFGIVETEQGDFTSMLRLQA
ncbi:hypothetical protein BJY00DRAFT_325445 [Aspergillus carlsbadensis]|nr:hypothetical protein BJY00DRAFT_325445 [Aspergillus carlsbadensis]